MAKQTRTRANPQPDPGTPQNLDFSIEQRVTMIREAAYYHYVNRGYTPGHDLDDWLAAESELERGSANDANILTAAAPQESGVSDAPKAEKPKRRTKQNS